MSFNNLTLNNSLLSSGYSGLQGLQQPSSASSTGWGTGASLLQMNSPYTNSSMVSGLSADASNSSYYGNDSLGMNEMGSFLGFLSAIVTMVTTLLLTQALKNASASNNSNNTSSSSEPSDESSITEADPTPTPAPASPAPAPPAGSPTPPAASPTPPPPAPVPPSPAPAPVPPPANNTTVQTDSINGGGPNELVIKNTDSKPMTIALFENTGPGLNPNIDDPNHKYTVEPGQTLMLSMPASWQGRAQKLCGNANDPASWAEINYEPGQNGAPSKIWYDLSLIRGYNSAVTMRPTDSTDNSEVAGTEKSIIDGAPADAITTDAGGNKVIKDAEGYDGGTNQAAIDYYNSAVGNSNAYVRNWDHNAVRTTQNNSLTVTFGAA